MNNLVLKEKQEFMGIQIPVIEGGFGEGQKVVLAKTVAEIHGVSTPDINKLINRNIERFTINDLIDLKTQSSRDHVLQLGFTNAEYGNASNVFLLSQRGYTKLVAMMDNSNDKKWDVMNKLIDDYFNLRGQAQRLLSPKELLEAQFQYTKEIDTRVSRIEDFVEATELSMADSKRLTKLAKGIVVRLLGGKASAAYKELSKQVFSDLYKQLHREFGVTSISEIKKKDCDTAKEIIQGYKLPLVLKEQVLILNNQISIGEAM